ncbi:MAG: hypothetical protein HZA34_00180 [Candidatus Pacebacteria bacterium]|nr:hypothetical protein [Candidatus Paceibacterota bacterium]
MVIPHASTFVFSRYAFDQETRTCTFYYGVQMEDEKFKEYVEILTFPSLSLDSVDPSILEPFLQSLHLILGISYWKMYCPRKIQIQEYDLSQDQAQFWNTVYTKGLGEFFYTNAIDYRDLVQFPSVENKKPRPVSLQTSGNVLLPMGGGKDSIVSAELLKKDHKQFDIFVLNPTPLHEKIAELLEKTPIIVRRKLDQKMLDLSREKHVYTGHVPMTAIYTFITLFVAAVRGDSAVILSNERSANYGNAAYLGDEINHQWSKSEEFESLLDAYIEQWITPNIRAYSLLRTYDELEIVKRFVQYPQYFHYFSSCNRNFAITGSKNTNGSLWCGTCPKCAFVFSTLAAYLPKEKVVGIVGKNMYADATLIPLYKQLLGVESVKPFECVGTPQEEKRAFDLARQHGEYADDPVMQMYMQVSGDAV